jgi:hypothetical protein
MTNFFNAFLVLVWKSVHVGNKQSWICQLCDDGRLRDFKHIERHENTALHLTLLEEAAMRELHGIGEIEDDTAPRELPTFLALVDSGTRNLLESISGGNVSGENDGLDNPNYSPPPVQPLPFEGWGVLEAHGDAKLTESLEKQGIALIAKSILARFDELSIGSADNDDEQSVVNEDEVQEPTVAGIQIISFTSVLCDSNIFADDDNQTESSRPPLKRARDTRNDHSLNPSAKWFPWQDKIVRMISSFLMIMF